MPFTKSNFSLKIEPKVKTKTATNNDDKSVIAKFINTFVFKNSVFVKPSIVFCLKVPKEYSFVILLITIIAKKNFPKPINQVILCQIAGKSKAPSLIKLISKPLIFGFILGKVAPINAIITKYKMINTRVPVLKNILFHSIFNNLFMA